MFLAFKLYASQPQTAESRGWTHASCKVVTSKTYFQLRHETTRQMCPS